MERDLDVINYTNLGMPVEQQPDCHRSIIVVDPSLMHGYETTQKKISCLNETLVAEKGAFKYIPLLLKVAPIVHTAF